MASNLGLFLWWYKCWPIWIRCFKTKSILQKTRHWLFIRWRATLVWKRDDPIKNFFICKINSWIIRYRFCWHQRPMWHGPCHQYCLCGQQESSRPPRTKTAVRGSHKFAIRACVSEGPSDNRKRISRQVQIRYWHKNDQKMFRRGILTQLKLF